MASSGSAEVERDLTRDIRLEVSSSNRSSCQVCKEKIEKDSIRVAHPSRSSNVSIMKYVHPSCYLSSCVRFENSKCKSKCRLSKHEIGKHELRLTMALTSCEGKLKDQVFFHPPHASTLVRQLLDAAGGTEHTFDQLCVSLPQDAKTWARDALSGVDLTGRRAPTVEPEVKPRAPKKKRAAEDDEAESAAKKPRAKKAKAVSEYFTEDGDPFCDGDQNDGDAELVD